METKTENGKIVHGMFVDGSVRYELCTISPEWMRNMLEKHNHKNRSISQSHMKELEVAMTKGEWKNFGKGIPIDCEGELIDGQHTLTGAVAANIPLKVILVYGVDPNVRAVVDTGKKRIGGDLLFMEGGVGAKADTFSSCIRTIIKLQEAAVGGKWPTRTITNSEILSVWKEYSPDLEIAIKNMQGGIKRQAKIDTRMGLVPVSMRAALFFLFLQKSSTANRSFWECMFAQETESPIVSCLKNFLVFQGQKKTRGGVTIPQSMLRKEYAKAIICGWNLTRRGSVLKTVAGFRSAAEGSKNPWEIL